MSENALKESSLGPRFSDVAGVRPVLACVTTRRHDKASREGACGNLWMDRCVVPTNQNPRLTRLGQA